MMAFRITLILLAVTLAACTVTQQPTQAPTAPTPTGLPPANATVTALKAPETETLAPTASSLNPAPPWLVYRDADGKLIAADQDGIASATIPIAPSDLVHVPFSASPEHPILSVLTSSSELSSDPAVVLILFPRLEILTHVNLRDCPHRIEGCEIDDKADVTRAPIWSPDGRYVAFIGAIDGPSADLYAYDADEGAVTRLTSGANQVGSFTWSPDSQWIVHEEVSDFYDWVVEAVWAAKADGAHVQWIYSPPTHSGQEVLGWTTDDRFVVFEHDWEGDSNIRLAGIREGLIAQIFAGYFHDPSVDPKSGTISFWPVLGAPNTPPLELGTYLVSPSDTHPRLVGGIELAGAGWDSRLSLFISSEPCPGHPDQLLAFDIDAKTTCAPSGQGSTSPDGKWRVRFDEGLTAENLAESTSNSRPGFFSGPILWRPDSDGFFLVQGPALYHFTLPSLDARLVDDHLLSENPVLDLYWANFTWVGN